MTTKKQFIGYTCGFMASHDSLTTNKLMKAEFNRLPDGAVEVSAVSGNSLGQIKKMGVAVVSPGTFEDRPQDPYDDTVEARWALGLLGATM